MKAIILAAGTGARLGGDETLQQPQALVEIGGKPLLWHIMNTFSAHGVREFVVALGAKADVVKGYFLNFHAVNHDLSVDLATGETVIHDGTQPPWRIHLVDTGLTTQTGGRLKRLEPWIGDDEVFCVSSGDCLADLDVTDMLAFHRMHGKVATVTAVIPPARPGRLTLDGHQVTHVNQPPRVSDGAISGGHFVLRREVLDYVDDDDTEWERAPLERLVRDGELIAYRHDGFWSRVETTTEKRCLEELWATGRAPWKVWA
jgi:glucose-1-phosphate cytidylyltransferase